MPRQPNETPIACQFFTWRLLRRNGVFYADGRGGKFHLGKHSLGTRDRDEAIVRLRQLDHHKAADIGLPGANTVPSVGTISISDGWKLFLEYCGRSSVLGGVSAATVKRYQPVRDKHVKFCAAHGIEDWVVFNKSMLERHASQLSQTHAERTVFLELTMIKSVVGWLIDNKHLPGEYKLIYSLRKPQGTDTYCYSLAEVSAMITHCKASPKLTWLAQVMIVLTHTGLRISELTNLRWSDIHLDQKTIRVADERASRRKQIAGTARTTKGRRSRTVPIHSELQQLLLTIKEQPDGYVLHAQRGGRITPRNVLIAFINSVIEPLKSTFPTPTGEIGFEHGRLHSFRHFFCSQAFLGGASEGEIKEWLGHADSKMVEHYRHLRSEDAQRKMNAIDFLGRAVNDPSGS